MSGDWITEDVLDGENATNATNAMSGGLTCAARSIRSTAMLPYSNTLTTTVRSFLTMFYIIISLSGISLNSLVIVLVLMYKKLHTRTFTIALQVVVPNLLLSSTVLLLRPVTSIANGWLFGEALCIITGYVYLTCLFLRALLMLVFVVDRFLTVFFLFSYPKHSKTIMLVASIATWVFAIVARVIGFPGILDCYSYTSSAFLCLHSSRCSTECARAANVNLAVILGPATIIPIVLYSLLYWKARNLTQRCHALTTAPSSSSRFSISHVRKQEWKANVTFFMLFVAVFVLTTPVVTLNLIFVAVMRKTGPSPVWYVFSSILSTMSSVLVITDPVVIMRHQDVRGILCEAKKTFAQYLSSKLNGQIS